MFVRKLIAAFALIAYAATAAAGNDTDELQRRWAVIAGMNLSCPTTASVERSPRDVGNTAAFASPQCNVLVEYYLPQQHFSVVGGYNAETVQWFDSKVDATMQNIVVGARYYPLSKSFALQPYASLMTYTNVASRHVQHSMSAWNGGNGYERNSTISLPRVSIAPTVGLDCYIFSSLALEFQYGFPLAIDGKAHVATTCNGRPDVYRMRSNMHRHNIQIGLKATFPFRFTSADGNSLFTLIEMALGIYDPADEKKQETKKERRRMKLGRVLDSY